MKNIELKFDNNIALPVRTNSGKIVTLRSVIKSQPDGASILLQTQQDVSKIRSAAYKAGKKPISKKRSFPLHGEDGVRVWIFSKEPKYNTNNSNEVES
jgi:hypothetical protein